MDLRIVATAYALPPNVETVDSILAREKERVEAAMGPLDERMRRRTFEDLGVNEVRVCGPSGPYPLALEAAAAALAEAGLPPRQLDLIIDYSTLPGDAGEYVHNAARLSSDLGAETSLNLSYKLGGCAGLHVALKNAAALMAADRNLRSALLVAADSPPAGSRSILPIAVQGDAASAVILLAGGTEGISILATEVTTLGHLHDAITVSYRGGAERRMVIDVDSKRIADHVMPIYYLNFHRLIHKVLDQAGLKIDDIDHFVYSNISRTDREGFIRALRLPPERVCPDRLADLGHTFASDLVINYTGLRQTGPPAAGQTLLFASAGIGFTWGVTLARA